MSNMKKVSVEEMLQGKKSRYALVIGVAKRAREISAEYEQTEKILNKKPVLMAVDDLKSGRYSILEPDEDE